MPQLGPGSSNFYSDLWEQAHLHMLSTIPAAHSSTASTLCQSWTSALPREAAVVSQPSCNSPSGYRSPVSSVHFWSLYLIDATTLVWLIPYQQPVNQTTLSDYGDTPSDFSVSHLGPISPINLTVHLCFTSCLLKAAMALLQQCALQYQCISPFKLHQPQKATILCYSLRPD